MGAKSELNLGFAAQNIIPPEIKLVTENEILSSIYRVGAALSVPVLYRFASFDTLSLFVDLALTENRMKYYSGAQYCLMGRYFLRAGYYDDHITAGAGCRAGQIQADYAV